MRILNNSSAIDFPKSDGLVPAIIQDTLTRNVLMLGYMNKEALDKTLAEQKVTFYSRSKQRLWTKGESSDHFLLVHEVLLDCDSDTLLILVKPLGPTCHTGDDTCFATNNEEPTFAFLDHLEEVIRSRKQVSGDSSYTRQLFDAGINKMAQKVGEEGVETTIEAVAGNKERYKEEAADLLFHLMVLTHGLDLEMGEIIDVLKARHSKK